MKKVQVTLTISHKTFTDDNGRIKPYVAFNFDYCDETFTVDVKQGDKKLLNYLLKKNGFYDEEAAETDEVEE